MPSDWRDLGDTLMAKSISSFEDGRTVAENFVDNIQSVFICDNTKFSQPKVQPLELKTLK
jgi:hypothetical protein